eukprot:SAG31_NODE_5321_length_2612_cov_2.787505_2_plen_96_part_00
MNQNAVSIEDLVSVRKNQCTHLVKVVKDGVASDLAMATVGSINHHWCLGLQREAEERGCSILGEQAETFNDNVRFTSEVIQTVQLVRHTNVHRHF